MKRILVVITISLFRYDLKTPNVEEDVDLHFITFVQKDGDLYELDGAKEGPINYGHCGDDLLDVNKVFFISINSPLT